MKLYLSSKVVTTLTVSVMGNEVTLPLSDAGFYGVCPVFKTKEEAAEFSGSADVLEVEISDKPKEEAK